MRSEEGLTVASALAAGFAIGASSTFTDWWQYAAMACIVCTFLARVLR